MAGKDRAVRWAQNKPARAIVWVAVVGIVVGLLVGVAAGFKIEQHRVHHDLAKLHTQLAGGGRSTTTTHGKSKGASGFGTLPVERVGDVTATGTNTITVATKRHGSLLLHLAGSTKVDQAVTGSAADVSVGRRVIVAKGGHDVIVLPAGRTLGRKVTKVDNGVVSVTKIKGVALLPLSKVQTVDTTSAASAADIKTGSHVVAWCHPIGKGAANAIEIIVLPAGSAFG